MDESESSSWKGHSFTLLVFGGIVVLCSIFFVLGMLVGRDQGQRIAELAEAEEMTRKIAAQPLPDSQPLDYFNQTTRETPDDTLQPRPTPPIPPTKAEDSVPAPAPPAEPDPEAAQETARISLQILATKDSKEATQAQGKVQSKGFRAMILSPKPGDKDAFYRVVVGPFDSAEAAVAKRDLEALGYKDVFRK